MQVLVDSQADISIVKESAIQSRVAIDLSERIYIKGITNHTITSLGILYMHIKIGKDWVAHKVHVVPDNFEIPVSGILGKDFLKDFNCNIDYSTMTLTVTTSNCTVVLNIFEGPDKDSLIIPPRCEVVRHFKVVGKVSMLEDQVVHPTEIAKGVFLSRAIFNPNSPLLKVLNVNSEAVIIKNLLPETENLSNYDVYSADKIDNANKARGKKVTAIVGKGVPEYVKKELGDLCEEFSDVFALETDKMSVNNFYSQKLRITDHNPVYVKNYRLPQSHKAEIDRQVKNLLENDLIEPSCSNYNSPLILVPKPDLNGQKRWRMCVDYRLVNKKLIADKYPLPRIDEILDSLGRAKFFSVLDLFSGFHQIKLEKDSRDITSFSTSEGSYRWKVLPFGLNVSPNSFSRMMSLAFAGANQIQYFLYMDDVIVVGNSVAHHLKNLRGVFSICRGRNLKLNPLKCRFFRPEVTYLGHLCTSEGILPDPNKISCVLNYPAPTDKDAAKRFVAFANYYRRFLRHFAATCRPLNRLSRKNVPFIWTKECQESFDKLKEMLSKPPVLAYPDFTKPFVITTDASKFACGAVLSQDVDGIERPIAFASRAFTQGEINKITKEQELIAIHWAVKHFRPYVYDTFFTIKSDHKSLIYLFSLKDPSSRLTRIRLDLEEHNFVIEHIKGKDNVVADALSRIHIDELKSIRVLTQKVLKIQTRSMTKAQNESKLDEPVEVRNNEPKVCELLRGSGDMNIPTMRTVIKNDRAIIEVYTNKEKEKFKPVIEIDVSQVDNARTSLEKIFAQLELKAGQHNIAIVKISEKDVLFSFYGAQEIKIAAAKMLKKLKVFIVPSPQQVKDRNEQLGLVQQFHDDLMAGGHPGQKRLYAKLRQRYVWKNMSKDVAKFVKSCDKCLLNKIKIGNKEPLVLTETPLRAFDKIVIDLVGPLPMSEAGNRYALTIICDLTKYVVGIAIPDKEASTVARALVNYFLLIYGFAREILSDLGSEFKNEVFKCLTVMLKMKHSFSTPHRHQTLSSIERNHRSLNEHFRIYLPEGRHEWDQVMRYFIFTYNSTPNVSLGLKYSPFELVYGKKPMVIDCVKGDVISPVYNVDEYANEVRFRLQLAHVHARDLLDKAKLRNKKLFDKTAKANPIELKHGDKVLLTNDGRKHKHESPYKGPYVVEEVGETNVIIKTSKEKSKEVHKNRLRKVK
ncbi:reverse transcriptase domain-containing protein [Lactovum miscens]|uniref:reverse transcriptase domain-containing protein n=1 Tax=Lactovum miscens TaxID=190387 RepID=UPI002EDA6E0B